MTTSHQFSSSWIQTIARSTVLALITFTSLAIAGCKKPQVPIYESSPTPITIADIVHLEARFGELDPETRARVDELLLEARRDWRRWRQERDQRFRTIAAEVPASPASDIRVCQKLEDFANESLATFDALDNAWLDRFDLAVAGSAWGAESADAVRLLRSRRAMERSLATLRRADQRLLDVRAFVEGTTTNLPPATAATLDEHENQVAERLHELARMSRQVWTRRLAMTVDDGELTDRDRSRLMAPIEERARDLVDLQTGCINIIASTLQPLDAAALRMAWCEAIAAPLIVQAEESQRLGSLMASAFGPAPARAPRSEPARDVARQVVALARRSDVPEEWIESVAAALLDVRRRVLEEFVTGDGRQLIGRLSAIDEEIQRLVDRFPKMAPIPTPTPQSNATALVAPWAQPQNWGQMVEERLESISRHLDAMPLDRKLAEIPELAGVPGMLSLNEAIQFEFAVQSLATPRTAPFSSRASQRHSFNAGLAALDTTVLKASALDCDPNTIPILELAVDEVVRAIPLAFASLLGGARGVDPVLDVPLSLLMLSLSPEGSTAQDIARLARHRHSELERDLEDRLLSLREVLDDVDGIDQAIGEFCLSDPLSGFDLTPFDLVESRSRRDNLSADDAAAIAASMFTRLADALPTHFASQAAVIEAASHQGLVPHGEVDRIKQVQADWARMYVTAFKAMAREALVGLGVGPEDPILNRFPEMNMEPVKNKELQSQAMALDEVWSKLRQASTDSISTVEPSSPTQGADAEMTRRHWSQRRDHRLELEAVLPDRVGEIREFEAKNRFGRNLDQGTSSFAISELEEALYRAAQWDQGVATIWDVWRTRVPSLLEPMLIGERDEPSDLVSTVHFEFDLDYAESLLDYRDTLVRAIRDAAAACESQGVADALRKALLEVPFAGDGERHGWD